ncbi:hypothetical protein [Effusibacillus dendaii]|uniref:Uncharacterized protein n=1 Tax=Effusibacillus dendaii TaxID=2743772 RepID=A0A7I8D8W3_9BACL|nr:hypothetical protein [Effusibacillus dendaii]BCJ85439.1 hypothetical protein skT53_04240 [Effusibacillus dendaii]
MSRIRLLPTLIFFAAAMILLFGGWTLYRDFGLVRPLEQELKGTHQVVQVDVTVKGTQKSITVSMNRVDDLQTAYRDIIDKVSETFNTETTVKIRDKRTPEMEALFQAYQPVIYEGISKGSFTDMIDTIQKRAKQDGMSRAVVTMDRENIYVQLEQADHYLYEVIPYNKLPVSQQGVKTL